ncbi:MAG: DUF5689 domain-containing protein [Chitinophagaceae bacterium]
MNNFFNRLFITKPLQLLAIAGTLVGVACQKTETVPVTNPPANNTATVSFNAPNYLVRETDQVVEAELTLSKALLQNANLTISLTAEGATYGTDFTTEPAAENGIINVVVPKNSRVIPISIKPINNNQANAVRRIRLNIQNPSSPLQLGTNKQTLIELLDDDVQSVVNFKNTLVTIEENSGTAYEVELNFQPQAPADGWITLQLQSANAQYGTHFTTTPGAVNNQLRIPVTAGATQIKAGFTPINDFQHNSNRIIDISIVGLSNGVQAGNNTQLRLTINNDDVPQNNFLTIEAIKRGFTGSPTYFLPGSRIQGMVVSHPDNIAANSLYVQDGTSGIAIKLPQTHNLRFGDLVTIELEGGLLKLTNGIPEISGITRESITKTGTDIMVIPTYNLTELLQTSAHTNGTLVNVRNVRFTQANGSVSFVGDKTISDGIRTALVRTENFASFSNRPLPTQAVNVIGIFQRINNQAIIIPLNSESIY